MSRFAPIAVLTLVCAFLPLAAQTPLLTAARNPDVNSRDQWVLQNHYRAPATEWLISVAIPEASGAMAGRPILIHRYGLPAVGDSQPIPAGGSRAILKPASAIITDLAVIYADGASAGDPIVIQDMLQARQGMLDDLRQIIPMLTAASQNPAENYASLEATLKNRSQQFNQQMETTYLTLGGTEPGVPITADRVCGPMAKNIATDLKAGMNPKAMAAKYALLAKWLTGWEQQLETSRPALR